jgi:hypothetical protein
VSLDYESVGRMFVNRNRELCDETMEEEINPLNVSGKGNAPCLSKVLRENRNDVIEFNACDKADDIKGKKEEGGLGRLRS